MTKDQLIALSNALAQGESLYYNGEPIIEVNETIITQFGEVAEPDASKVYFRYSTIREFFDSSGCPVRGVHVR